MGVLDTLQLSLRSTAHMIQCGLSRDLVLVIGIICGVCLAMACMTFASTDVFRNFFNEQRVHARLSNIYHQEIGGGIVHGSTAGGAHGQLVGAAPPWAPSGHVHSDHSHREHAHATEAALHPPHGAHSSHGAHAH